MTIIRRPRFERGALVALELSLGLSLLGIARPATAGPTFVVTSTADVAAGPNTTDGVCETATGNGICTLRAAIMEANAGLDAIVQIPAGVYALSIPSTGLGRPEDGDLDVLRPMKIEGAGPSVSIVDGNQLTRAFAVRLPTEHQANRVEIRGLTIQRGMDLSPSGGGGVYLGNLSRVLIENTHLTANVAVYGGAVAAFGPLTLRHVLVMKNGSVLDSLGGGILFGGSQDFRVEDSRIEGNRACAGGGLFALDGANLRIERTAIVANAAPSFLCSAGTFVRGGGGVHSLGNLVLSNALLHENEVTPQFGPNSGSGILASQGTLQLINATITKNSGNGTIDNQVGGSSMAMSRSILTSNPGADCLSSAILSGDYNLLPGEPCPMIGQLLHNPVNFSNSGFDVRAFNGGFSPDVSSLFTVVQYAVPSASCLDDLGGPLTTDFRGHRRKPPSCDIGAHDANAIYAPPQLLGVNLVRNGGGAGSELGLAASVANPLDRDHFQAPYWAQNGPMIQLLYGAPGGYPMPGDSPPGSGHKFFSGGESSFTVGKQSFDLSAIAGQIDAGTLPYEVAGAFGGYLTNDDRATLTTEFFDASGQFLSAFSLGGFSAEDRGNQTRLIRAVRNGLVPVGTRFIDLTLNFERFDGLANDGYADALSVTLPEPGLATALGVEILAATALVQRRRRLARRSAGDALRRSATMFH